MMVKNCPFISGLGVRIKRDWVSALSRNHCPLKTGLGVRIHRNTHRTPIFKISLLFLFLMLNPKNS